MHGRAGGADAVGLEQVIGQLGVRPVGTVQPLLGRPLDDPAFDLVGQRGGDLAGGSLGLAGLQAVEAAFQIGIEPTGNGAAVDAQVGGDVLVGPAAVGKQDNLEPVAEFAVLRGAEQLLEPLDFGRGELNADHGCFLLLT
jgi:hypothetical protein